MTGLLTLLPPIVALVLWAQWYAEGDAHPAWKWTVLLLSLCAVWLQFFTETWAAGLLLQVVIATGLLLWNRWHDARYG